MVPTNTALEGPFGPAFITSTDGFGADDASFMNFFNVCNQSFYDIDV